MFDPRCYTLMALFHLFKAITAQNITFNRGPYDHCSGGPGQFAPDAVVNSSGKIGFQFGEAQNTESKNNVNDWYLSVTFNDTRRQNNANDESEPEISQWISSWLSVPNEITGSVCIHALPGINVTADGTGHNGCDGVLSSDCLSALKTAANSGGLYNMEYCPDFPVTDELKKHCGNDVGGTVTANGLAWTSKPVDVSNGTCTIPAPPHISIPNDYHTYSVLGTGSGTQRDFDISSFEWYDIRVQQPIPFIVVGYGQASLNSNETRPDAQVVCVAPNSVVNGSRTPVLRFGQFQDSLNTGPGLRGAWRLAVSVAGVAGLVLML